MTDIDKKLKDIANSDWEQFMEIVGDEFILVAKARLLRKNGKSWQQISLQLKISPSQARTAAKSVKSQQLNVGK